jgi:hypothetical protein
MKKKFSTNLGQILAYLQDTVDSFFAFVFEELRQSGSTKVKEDDHFLKKCWVKTADFFGDLGMSFYDKYNEIKENRAKKKKK